MIGSAVSIVLAIFALIAVGMLLTQMGWLDAAGAKLLGRLTVNVGLTGLVLSNMMTEFTRETLITSLPGIAVSFGSILLTIGLGFLLARIARIDPKRRGAFVCMIGFSNAVFIGLPVAVALFGEVVMPFALLYYQANTSIFWSLGNYLLARDGGQPGALEWKKLVPLPLIAFLLSIVLILLGAQLPSFVLSTGKYLGGLVTPISLIYTGYVIMGMIKRRMVRWRKGYGWIMLGRFVLGPAILLLAVYVIPIPTVMRNALLIQSAMPVMAQTTIVAGDKGADAEYVAGGIALTTALTLAVTPIYYSLLPLF